MRFACDTQYTDRQTNRQTDQQLTHPTVNPHLGRRVRAYGDFHVRGVNRERYALRSCSIQATTDRA